MKYFKIICGIVTTIIIICLVSLVAVFFVPKLTGYETMAVISGSMEPNIGVGSLVLAKETECTELKKDDIVTYKLQDGTRVTHRIVSNNTKERTIITKGDANDTEDINPIAYADVVGKMEHSYAKLGYISIYAKTPLGITGVCVITFLLLITLFLPDILSESKEEESKEIKEAKN